MCENTCKISHKYLIISDNLMFWVSGLVLWKSGLVFVVSGFVFGCLDLHFGCLDLYFGCLDSYFGCPNFVEVSMVSDHRLRRRGQVGIMAHLRGTANGHHHQTDDLQAAIRQDSIGFHRKIYSNMGNYRNIY